jgi:DNA-binding CsgD family transcriptional regulator
MDSNNQSLEEVIILWEKAHQLNHQQSFNVPLNAADLIASFFCPGEFYYFILNFFDVSFEFVHPNVKKVIGCSSEDFNFGYIFEKMHPDDLENIKWKEEAAAQFFYHQLTTDKIPLYKSTYTFRIKSENGNWKNILHQSITLQLNEDSKMQYVLCVHSDITFITPVSENQISFIGIKGEPSFYALSTEPNTFLKRLKDLEVSAREIEIVKLLAEGLSSKQIASQLYLSTHTVDTHRRNMLKKTGTRNTLELAVLCLRRGII